MAVEIRHARVDVWSRARGLVWTTAPDLSTIHFAPHDRISPVASPRMSPRHVLVTGGAGFVGSHIVDGLVGRGDTVVVVDDLSTGDRANVRAGVDLRVVDISDGPALGRAVEGERFDAVVHCAAKTKVVQSMEQADLYRRVIVDGTRNVVDAALATGARDLVNLSTGGAIYGETPDCAHEETELHPPSNYGRFKAEAEEIVRGAALRGITLRLANAYGPRQRQDLEGGVIAIFLGAWRRKEPLVVYGDGTAQRDYVYVSDICDAVTSTLESGAAGVYNIGTGVATSVNELVEVMSAVLGPPPAIRRDPPRSSEVQRSCLDIGKAARDGLWRPRTDLREGIEKTARLA
jgi:UDP-glucose 4-epimerase